MVIVCPHSYSHSLSLSLPHSLSSFCVASPFASCFFRSFRSFRFERLIFVGIRSHIHTHSLEYLTFFLFEFFFLL